MAPFIDYDEDGKYIGVNKLSGNDMLIFMSDNEIQTITFIKDPEGTMSPLKDVSPKDVILRGFNWRITEKPIPYRVNKNGEKC